MKKFISFVKNSIFFSAICITVLLFASCENFLKAQDTAEQIKEAIEIANSNPTTIYIEAEKDSGTVTPSQVRVKKKETFDMKFSPADNWKFIGWGVYDRNTNEPVTDAIKFDDATKLEVKATVLKAVDNLIIRPDCLKLPAIVSATPGDGQASYANTPIKLTFNMQMEEKSVTTEDSLFKYGPQNIYISYGSVYMAEYFEEPRFNSDKTVLTLTPKASKLQNFIATENKPFIDIQVSFGEKIIVKNGDNELPVANDSQEITVRYRKDTETTPPDKYDFYASASSDFSKHFTQDALSTFTDSKILQNRTNGKIYIYGRYYDADSGVSTVTLTEKHTNARDGSLAPVTQDPKIFTAANADFMDDGNGTTTFCIEYDLKSDDGAILISVIVKDGCDIPAEEEQTFTVIKDSGIDLSGVELWNLDFVVTDSNTKFFTYDGTEDAEKIPYEEYQSMIKEIKLNALNKRIYASCYTAENDMSVVLSYKDNSEHNMIYDSEKNRWSYTLNDVTDVSSLELKLTVTDDLNNTDTKVFIFPEMPNLITIDLIREEADFIQCNALFSTKSKFTNLISSPEYISGAVAKICYISNEDNLATNMNSDRGRYRFALLNNFLAGPLTPEYTTDDRKIENSNLPPVVVKNATMNPSSEGEYLNISITIDTDNGNPWDTYESIIAQHSVAEGQGIVVSVVEKNALSVNFNVPFTVKKYNSPNFVKLIGFTSTEVSPSADYNWFYIGTPSQNPAKFDNRKPSANNWSSDNLYAYSIGAMYKTFPNLTDRYDFMMPYAVTDYETGIKKLEVITNGGYRIYSGNSLTLKELYFDLEDGIIHSFGDTYLIPFIPIWDADKENNDLIIKFYDAQDNCLEWHGNISFITPPSFSLKKNTVNTLISDETYETLYRWRLGITKLNPDTNVWSNHTEITTTPGESTGANEGKVYTYTNVDLPLNQFVKVVSTAALEDNTSTPKFGNSVPYYIYTGSTKNSHEYDYVASLGSSKSEVLVVSDAPTFVHTLVTKYPLSECQNWTVEQWEHNHKHIGDKYMTFPTENPTARKYTIPVGSMDTGDCYVVIAHFADGTSAMSEVMQK